jgi:hypothetical protein
VVKGKHIGNVNVSHSYEPCMRFKIKYIWIDVRVDVEQLWQTGKHVGGRCDMCIGSEPIRSNVYWAAANQ